MDAHGQESNTNYDTLLSRDWLGYTPCCRLAGIGLGDWVRATSFVWQVTDPGWCKCARRTERYRQLVDCKEIFSKMDKNGSEIKFMTALFL